MAFGLRPSVGRASASLRLMQRDKGRRFGRPQNASAAPIDEARPVTSDADGCSGYWKQNGR